MLPLYSQSLETWIQRAHNEGPDVALSIACELERVARLIRKDREDMPADEECSCHDCGRIFVINRTIAQMRLHGRPDDCPDCYDKRSPNDPSQLRPFVTYK